MAQTLAEKITALIAQQQQEVAQLQRIVDVELPTAKTKLANLQTALAALTVPFETNINRLKALGVHLDE